ncbi:MAG: SAM-dependent methyltransferase [Candidatus Woesearchaeota archaeon]
MENKLYIVATPIGNLEDISLRALKTLRECDAIISEDTRETLKLLKYYKIKKPLIRGDDYSRVNFKKVFERYKKIAFLSDRGCPNISDPGGNVIKQFLDFVNQDYSKITLIPGSSSIEVVSLLPFNPIPFVFLGFTKKLSEIEVYLKNGINVLYFESCHRINKSIQNLLEFPVDKIYIFHEITKLHESIFVIENTPVKLPEKGEYTVFLKVRK